MKLPNKIILASGVGFGTTEITAFDNALLKAGVGNYNLIKVSSIIPPNSQYEGNNLKLLNEKPIGSLLPAVYTYTYSRRENQPILSAIMCGFPKDKNNNGVIFKYSGNSNPDEAKFILNQMLDEASKNRNTSYISREFIFAYSKNSNIYTCSLAVALLL